MFVTRKEILRGLHRGLVFCAELHANLTSKSSLRGVELYHAVYSPKDSQLHWCTQIGNRRESSACVLSEVLKQPSGQQDFFKLLGM